jgi:hypothetical protein
MKDKKESALNVKLNFKSKRWKETILNCGARAERLFQKIVRCCVSVATEKRVVDKSLGSSQVYG